MSANLTILESRVDETADRLKKVCSERDRLESEVGSLKRKVADLTEENVRLSGGLSRSERRRRIDAVTRNLRETIEELRNE